MPPPPCFWGEGNTRWRERGWESPNSDEGHTLWYSLYVRTLCGTVTRYNTSPFRPQGCMVKRIYKLYISLPIILKMPPSRLGGIGRGELWGKCQQTKHKSPGKHLCSYISQGIHSPHQNIFCTVHD